MDKQLFFNKFIKEQFLYITINRQILVGRLRKSVRKLGLHF